MRQVSILTSRILQTFSKIVYANRGRIYRLWLVSPWIGTEDAGVDPLLLLIDAARQNRCNIIVITRPPMHAWHLKAVTLLSASDLATIYTSSHLHTKLYIAECNGFRAAVMGSPNLTPAAEQRNQEIAVEFRTTRESLSDDVSAVISDLTNYASSLRGDVDTRLL